MRYYSTQRPVAPGTFPQPKGNKILEIHNFDERIYCREPGRDCWGYIEYEKPLTEKEANDYELVRDRMLDFSQRYMATSGTSFLRTFATAKELNEWWEARDTEGRYFCRLYDCEKGIDILGSRYMFLKPEERFHDDPPVAMPDAEQEQGSPSASLPAARDVAVTCTRGQASLPPGPCTLDTATMIADHSDAEREDGLSHGPQE